MIVEVSWYAILFENEDVIWYHVGRFHFLSHAGEYKEGSTLGRVCCPFIVLLEFVLIAYECTTMLVARGCDAWLSPLHSR